MKEPLRVLMVTGEYPPMEGGVADFTSIIVGRLVERGARVEILTSVGAEDATRGHDQAAVHATMSQWGFRALYRQLHSLLSSFQPDVINVQYQTAAFGMQPAINFMPRFTRGVPVVVTFHDLRVPYLLPKMPRLRQWVNRTLAQKAAAVIATNAQDRADLQQWPGVHRIEGIPIGSNIRFHLPENYDRAIWRGQWGVSQRDVLLSFFGFLNDTKGAVELIQALHRLKRDNVPVCLMMIGGAVASSNASNREYFDRVTQTIEQLGLQDDVFWTGYSANDQVSAAFRSSDICVLPFSDGASFRRGSLMAALTHGTAIVSTQPQVELPEMVDRENIYLVPPRDPEAIANAVKDIVEHPELKLRLERGADELSHLFDWDGIADRTLDLFETVAHRTGR
ncbi:MAG: glycosyltransferase family 4 protein [Anaerolineae bacterium]|jgi:glycosyltransferase involved in cell wall biosynthesis|nr:glycosyltransferase family 4 protein [Chloroflexota bacterium]